MKLKVCILVLICSVSAVVHSLEENLFFDLLYTFRQVDPSTINRFKFPDILANNKDVKYHFNDQEKLESININVSKEQRKTITYHLDKQFTRQNTGSSTQSEWINNGIKLTAYNLTNSIKIERAFFSGKGKLDLPKETVILSFLQANVYNNGKMQDVYLLGYQEDYDSPFFNSTWLYTDEQDGVNETIQYLDSIGYDYKMSSFPASSIHLDEFKADHHYILITAFAGSAGWSQNFILLDGSNKNFNTILHSFELSFLSFKGHYESDYKAMVYFLDGEKLYFDLNKESFDEVGVYKDGQLIIDEESNQLWGELIVDTQIKKVNTLKDKMALVLSQQPRGPANYIRAGTIESWLMLDGNSWKLIKREAISF